MSNTNSKPRPGISSSLLSDGVGLMLAGVAKHGGIQSIPEIILHFAVAASSSSNLYRLSVPLMALPPTSELAIHHLDMRDYSRASPNSTSS
jgi:hypothetical protein